MSSTINVQNYLSNVFRPVYSYDPIGNVFQPTLILSNIDTVAANTISVFAAYVGDANSNVYVGLQAGNPFTLLKDCVNNTAIGAFAGNNISNVSNSVYLGYHAGDSASDASNVIAIGYNASGAGVNNIYMGKNTGAPGSGNIFIGQDLTYTSDISNSMYIGTGSYGVTLSADLSNKYVGINTTTPQFPLDVNGYTRIMNGLGINANPEAHSLNVNGDMFVSDGYGSMYFGLNAITTSTTITAAGGFNSIVNPTAGTSVGSGASATIGVLIKGIVDVMVTDSAGSNYAYRKYISRTATGTPTPNVAVTAGSAGTALALSGSNITISNTTGGALTYNWSITYSPVP
jgi:hypothetical protein